MKDSLWSVDLFRVESAFLQTHWVMVVLDQYTRRIIGFAVHAGSCDGVVYCRLFNEIVSGQSPPKYLSTDRDPLFRFHRWQANLRILGIEELKTVPYDPNSHPFVERLIGTVRREYLDHQLFFNRVDLQGKLNQFKRYYNAHRVHSSLYVKTPKQQSMHDKNVGKEIKNLEPRQWQSYCRGLFQLPIAV